MILDMISHIKKELNHYKADKIYFAERWGLHAKPGTLCQLSTNSRRYKNVDQFLVKPRLTHSFIYLGINFGYEIFMC